MLSVQKIAMLDALGITAYRRTPRVKIAGTQATRTLANADQQGISHRDLSLAEQATRQLSLAEQATRQLSLAEQATRQLSLAEQATRQISLAEQATRQISLAEQATRQMRASNDIHAARPAVLAPKIRPVGSARLASTRSELVMPSAELERFVESRMYKHLCLLLLRGEAIPAVENSVLSDTALHFEAPPKSPLKLGSMALLRSAWRAKRQAWLAIRLWRKQQ
jgi:hypothetical protein